MASDPWLERWLLLLDERCKGGLVLELGCGGGQDTALLMAHGFRVVALDLDAARLRNARERAPEAEFHEQDIRAPFPLGSRRPDAILASLSLHYFPWDTTLDLVHRIRETLPPGGLLLCRLNSTRDVHHGAEGHPELEQHFYQVGAITKRFFEQASVQQLFREGWRMVSLEEQTIHRYEAPKVVWEAILERDDTPRTNPDIP